jgi:hypothetical protein
LVYDKVPDPGWFYVEERGAVRFEARDDAIRARDAIEWIDSSPKKDKYDSSGFGPKQKSVVGANEHWRRSFGSTKWDRN